LELECSEWGVVFYLCSSLRICGDKRQASSDEKACDAKYANFSEAGADYYLVDVDIAGGSESGKARVRVPDGGFHCASVEKIHGTNRY